LSENGKTVPKTDKEAPTKPENHDPLLASFARLEGKVDKMLGMMHAFFDELNTQRKELNMQRLRVEALSERVSLELGDGP
jgi:hypothetical protein